MMAEDKPATSERSHQPTWRWMWQWIQRRTLRRRGARDMGGTAIDVRETLAVGLLPWAQQQMDQGIPCRHRRQIFALRSASAQRLTMPFPRQTEGCESSTMSAKTDSHVEERVMGRVMERAVGSAPVRHRASALQALQPWTNMAKMPPAAAAAGGLAWPATS